MVHDHTVALLESLQPFALLNDYAARLVTRNHARLIALRPFADVRAIDAADVRAADRGRLCLHQHLTVTRFRNSKFAQLRRAVSGQNRAKHFRIHVFIPP